MYKAIVTKLSGVRPHSNADLVKLATCHGNQVVVGLRHEEGELGVYFPSDGVLSHEFCHHNNLYRDSSQNRNPDEKPGMFDNNRRIRAQRFRGEISDGFWVPLSNFDFINLKINWIEGYEFDEISGTPICSKYITAETARAMKQNQSKKGTKTSRSSIMFKEHFDTEHFGKNLHKFDDDQTIVITEKLHGTSGRVGRVLTNRNLSWKDKVAKFFGISVKESEWQYLNGSRRVVLEESTGKGFHDLSIREKAFLKFKDNLRKGETVFFEIVGFEPGGPSIMPSVDTAKMKDKNFTATYGKTMTFSYGCLPQECKIYVYRITLTDEDGNSLDYSWNDVVKRCKELNVEPVPHIRTLTLRDLRIEIEEDIRSIRERFSGIIESYGSGPSVLDSRHIKEGVCVRIEGGLNNQTYKFKSFEFKVLEGIIKDSGVVDAEEAQG